MAGIVGLTEIQHQNATSAVTINSNGTMTPSKMVYATFALDGNNHAATASGYEVIDNWTTLSSPHTTLGATVSHSSGIFTFPHTGKYLVTLSVEVSANGGNRNYAGAQIKFSSTGNSGTFNNVTRALGNCNADGAVTHPTCTALINITDTSNDKIRFNSYVSGNCNIVHNDNSTMCIFQQVG